MVVLERQREREECLKKGNMQENSGYGFEKV
jgi:hypothetical protein